VILATGIFEKEQMNHVATRTVDLPGNQSKPRWYGRGGLIPKSLSTLGTSEQVIKHQLRSVFDKLGVWSRLEPALYMASHGGASWADDFEAGPNLAVAAAS